MKNNKKFEDEEDEDKDMTEKDDTEDEDLSDDEVEEEDESSDGDDYGYQSFYFNFINGGGFFLFIIINFKQELFFWDL